MCSRGIRGPRLCAGGGAPSRPPSVPAARRAALETSSSAKDGVLNDADDTSARLLLSQQTTRCWSNIQTGPTSALASTLRKLACVGLASSLCRATPPKCADDSCVRANEYQRQGFGTWSSPPRGPASPGPGGAGVGRKAGDKRWGTRVLSLARVPGRWHLSLLLRFCGSALPQCVQGPAVWSQYLPSSYNPTAQKGWEGLSGGN